MKKIILIPTIAFIALMLNSCKERKDTQKEPDKQLNITLLLDLSDRVDPQVTPNSPEHYQRDIAIVEQLVSLFKNDMEKKGGFMAKGRMKVIFSPKPEDPQINKIASNLNIDLSGKTPIEKKVIYDSISNQFTKNLEKIYHTTIQNKKYPGSDIWRFFKNDVKDYCISEDTNYRNIMVIITDGYLYHKNSKEVNGNRTTYLLPTSIQSNGLRSNNWREKFEKGDYGFITTRNDLDNLEILVLEVNPSNKSLGDEDVIRAYLEKWFKEMNVKKYKIYNTDLPEHTKIRIESFLKG